MSRARAEAARHTVQRQGALQVQHMDLRMAAGPRIEMSVAASVAVEVTAMERLLPVHDARLLARLKLSGMRPGLRIYFYPALIKRAIGRFAGSG